MISQDYKAIAFDESGQDGGHRVGNFRNYYKFHQVSERINLIPVDAFDTLLASKTASLLVCDIGCNEGDLTKAFKERLERICIERDKKDLNTEIFGVDIDPELVCRAQKKFGATGKKSSCHSPEALSDCKRDEHSSPLKDSHQHVLTQAQSTEECRDPEPCASARSRSPSPPSATAAAGGGGGGGLSFAVADLCHPGDRTLEDYLAQRGRKRFDIITCFSVTMWIHLNTGDEGLQFFLRRLAALCRVLVLEPQPWKCYRNAGQRLRRLKLPSPAHLGTIEMRHNVVENIVEFLTLPDFQLFHSSRLLGKTAWGRPLHMFCK